MVKVAVGNLLHKPEGSREDFLIDDHIEFDAKDGVKLTSNITAKIRLLKLPHEISAQVKDLNTSVEYVCDRCLTRIGLKIYIPVAEREFIIDLPRHAIEEGEDVYYMDKNSTEIDLSGMLREEILLHFPGVAVCSESCKGLCDKCGKNLNESDCGCKHNTGGEASPFKFLSN